jgi:MoaA/NifB/PqqE/SkfB family radical SAM enzyme
MTPYKIALNWEWTSKCNAKCSMCPREDIINPLIMDKPTFNKILTRIKNEDAFRCVIAGYGEPTTHPLFDLLIEDIRNHPVEFDMVTNGQLLDVERLKKIDGSLNQLIISFSSISKDIYSKVHVNLNYEKVKNNILLAKNILKQTSLGISLTPMPECLDTLGETVGWLRQNEIENLTMSPTLYNRGGKDEKLAVESARLRHLIKEFGLHSQELDFISGPVDFLKQTARNRFRCVARNSDLFISSNGEYLYCFNDISHSRPIGSVDSMSIREAIEHREQMPAISDLCGNCSLAGRYNLKEMAGVAMRYASR